MNIQEVQDILGICHALRAPKHIIIVNEPIHDENMQYFRGLQPKSRGDVLVLSAQADTTTVPHETIHANFGLGELAAYPGGWLLSKKYHLRKQLPLLDNIIPKKKIQYKEDPNPPEFPQVQKYGGRIRHYRLT